LNSPPENGHFASLDIHSPMVLGDGPVWSQVVVAVLQMIE